MTGGAADVGRLYLNLLKRTLTRYDMGDNRRPVGVKNPYVRRALAYGRRRTGLELDRVVAFDPAARDEGRDLPFDAETMVGLRRLDNLEHCVRVVVEEGVPGDLLEAGVWRGGSAIFMRALLEVLGDRDRLVWAADSFQGLPPPDPSVAADDGDRHHENPFLAAGLDQVKANFAKYGLLDERVRFLPGWFSDTLAAAPIERLAVLRADGDMYASTMDILEPLYPRVSDGGYVIIDDYGAVPACKQAVHDYRDRQGITEPMATIDWTGVYWRKAGAVSTPAAAAASHSTDR